MQPIEPIQASTIITQEILMMIVMLLDHDRVDALSDPARQDRAGPIDRGAVHEDDCV